MEVMFIKKKSVYWFRVSDTQSYVLQWIRFSFVILDCIPQVNTKARVHRHPHIIHGLLP